MSHVRLHRFLAQEEAVADLAVDQALRDQLENLDLTSRGLLLELPEGSCEWDDLCIALVALGRDLVKATRVADIAGQDLFALCSVHDSPRIGLATTRLYSLIRGLPLLGRDSYRFKTKPCRPEHGLPGRAA